jgi:hypothetical protein
MNASDVDLFLRYAAGFSLLITLLSVFRYRQRGLSAVFMGTASLLLAIAIVLYRVDAPFPLLVALGVIIFASLVGDIVVRSSKSQSSKEGGQ